MYLRCTECRATVRQALEFDGDVLHCTECGHAHSLGRRQTLGATPQERAERAAKFAARYGIDLATAYTVLLGLTSLDTLAKSGDSAPSDRPPRRRARYDPGFAQSVAEGRLTIAEAVDRGDRVAYASRLAQDHRLPLGLAFLVTDNRISLEKARERHARAATVAASQEARSTDWLVPAALATLLVAAIGWTTMHNVSGPDRLMSEDLTRPFQAKAIEAPAIETMVAVRTDAEGRVTEVRAADPWKLLVGYCNAQGNETVVPEKIARSGEGWVGHYSHGDRPLAIAIRPAAQGRGFVAGDGLNPIFQPISQ